MSVGEDVLFGEDIFFYIRMRYYIRGRCMKNKSHNKEEYYNK